MIEILRYDGRKELINPSAIARVTEACVSSQYHGIKSLVKLFDGQLIESCHTMDEIAALLCKQLQVNANENIG